MKILKIKNIKNEKIKKINEAYSKKLGDGVLYDMLSTIRPYGGFLAGGAVQHLFDKSKKIKDLDFFFHYPESEEDNISFDDLEETVCYTLENKFDFLDLNKVSEFISNDGSKLVTYTTNKDITIQLVFSLSSTPTFEGALKERISKFDIYSSIFALRVKNSRYEIFTTRVSLYSCRYRLTVLNEEGQISPRNTLLRLSKQFADGWYTKRALSQLVDWVEKHKETCYEFNDFLKELDNNEFYISENRIRIPKSMFSRDVRNKYASASNGS